MKSNAKYMFVNDFRKMNEMRDINNINILYFIKILFSWIWYYTSYTLSNFSINFFALPIYWFYILSK